MNNADSLAGDAVSGDSTLVAGGILADRYVLDRPLRVGGMGVVWVAHSKALNVPVALKVLHSGENASDAVERMANEAHAAASLGHPAIVRVLDFGEAGGAPFIAMELLEGEDLSEILERQGKLPATQAVGLLLPIIDGLSAAHQRGIVHRDIKPENLFMARDAMGRVQPKVLDFGIAKLVDGRCGTRLTQSGTLLGTPQYLSPEQAYGRDDVDFRTDIWSLGVVLYELITGEEPFLGNNHNALIRSITQDEPARPPGVGDEQLWRIIDRCLEKEAHDRWESMWALGEALALWMVERGADVDATSRSLREVWLEGAVSGAVALMPQAAEESHLAAPAPSGPPSSPRSRRDSITRASVMTVQRSRAPSRRGALSFVGRTLGGTLLVALPFALWAFTQPRPQSGWYPTLAVLRASAPPEHVSSAAASVPPESRSAERTPPEPEAVRPAASAVATTKTVPKGSGRGQPKSAPVRKHAIVDPEFGF
jgi:eukaryotic-like serine/threonine-protein kinase